MLNCSRILFIIVQTANEAGSDDEPPDSWESRNWNVDPFSETKYADEMVTDDAFKVPFDQPNHKRFSDSDDSGREDDNDILDR